MKNELLHRANGDSRLLRVAWERSRDVCLNRYEKPLTNADSHMQMLERLQRHRNHVKQYSPQQLEALRLIYQWRDDISRKEDESPGYVLPNHMLLQIAEILPKEAQGVLACCNPIPPLLRQHVVAVHQLVKDARLSSHVTSNFKEPDAHSLVPVPAKTEHDTTSLLTCPHDLSHVEKTNHNPSKDCRVISRDTSVLFGPFSGEPIGKNVSLSRSSDSRCAFSKDNSKFELNREKLDGIVKSSWDPFMLFFPSNGDSRKPKQQSSLPQHEPNQPLTLRHMLSGDFQWKMRKLESNDAEKSEENDESPKTFGQIVDVPDEAKRSTSEQVQIIKKIMNPKRKKLTPKPAKLADEPVIHVDGISQDLQFAPAVDGVLSTFKKTASSNKGNKANNFKPDFAKKPKKFSKDRSHPNKRPFQPHQYSNEDYVQFKREKQKKRRFK